MKPPCAIATVQHRGSSGTTGGRYSVRFSAARMRSICCTRCGCWALISWCSVGSARMLYKPAHRHRQRAAGQSKGFAGRTASGAVHHGGAWQATGAIDTRRAVRIDGASPAVLIGRPAKVESRPTCNELVVALDQRVGREVQPGARGCRVGPDDHRPHATVRLRLNGFGPPFLDRFAAVSDRFSGSWCRFLESWGQDGEDGEKTGKKRRKMGEKWPKESGSNDG